MTVDTLGVPSLNAYEVTELAVDDPKWMIELLSNPRFSRVPPQSYQALLEGFSPVQVQAGETVLQQGDVGDYFYLIRRGHAHVTRQAPGGQQIKLADLGPGQTFGEEALLSGEPRNATVSFREAGEVMRLSAREFQQLLKTPMVQGVTLDMLPSLMAQGAQLIDVRPAEVFRSGNIKGALNLPLFLLRMRMEELDRQAPCVVYCDDGRHSGVAAFLMAQRGFNVRVLLGGLEIFSKMNRPEDKK